MDLHFIFHVKLKERTEIPPDTVHISSAPSGTGLAPPSFTPFKITHSVSGSICFWRLSRGGMVPQICSLPHTLGSVPDLAQLNKYQDQTFGLEHLCWWELQGLVTVLKWILPSPRKSPECVCCALLYAGETEELCLSQRWSCERYQAWMWDRTAIPCASAQRDRGMLNQHGDCLSISLRILSRSLSLAERKYAYGKISQQYL